MPAVELTPSAAGDRTAGGRARRRLGVDSYAYHRLLGEVRPGEEPPAAPFPRGSLDVVAEARALDLDVVLLETVFLGPAAAFPVDAYLEATGPVAVGFSWGAPDGFALGGRPQALADLVAWLGPAARLGLGVMRIVAGGPAQRGRSPRPVVPLLREACAAARHAGVVLALENHGDVTAGELAGVLAEVDDPALAVCLDTANLLRVGDDVSAAARELGPHVAIVHLKDCDGTWDDPVTGPVSRAPGDGVVPLEAVLDACPDAIACVELGQLGPGADERRLVRAYVDWLRAR